MPLYSSKPAGPECSKPVQHANEMALEQPVRMMPTQVVRVGATGEVGVRGTGMELRRVFGTRDAGDRAGR